MLQKIELLKEADISGAVLIGAYDGAKRIIGKISRKHLDDSFRIENSDRKRVELVANNFDFYSDLFTERYRFDHCEKQIGYSTEIWVFQIA